MYDNMNVPTTYPMEGAQAGSEMMLAKQRRLDVTLRQNIDGQIAAAEAHVKQLQETKARMEASGILDMRIDDIRRAMQF